MIELDPPAHYDLKENIVWHELLTSRQQSGCKPITPADVVSFDMLVQLTIKFRNREDLSSSERACLYKLLTDFNMTPKARAKDGIVEEPVNNFDIDEEDE